MATFPIEFIELAAELIGDEFAAFASPAAITQDQGFDYDAQTPNNRTQTKPMIRLDYKESQFDGDKIKIGDYMLVGEFQKFDWEPSPDNTTVLHDGIKTNIKLVNIDSAKAAIFLSVRRA